MVTAEQRRRLSSSQFACPSTKKFPIPTTSAVIPNYQQVTRNAHAKSPSDA